MDSLRIEAGSFCREPGTARAWVDPERGIAAAVYGAAAPAYGHDLFGQLGTVSMASPPADESAYPGRVVEAAQMLEALHRDLWQMQGEATDGAGLGAGVLVREDGRAYFLQVGSVLLYHRRDDRLTLAAGADAASPLLGAQVKSGIKVHTISIADGDELVVLASNLAEPLDVNAVNSCLSGAGDIESASEAMGALVDIAADGCAIIAMRMSIIVPEAVVPPPADPAATDEWSFEGDVVQELSSFMEELQDDAPEEEAPAPAPPPVETPKTTAMVPPSATLSQPTPDESPTETTPEEAPQSEVDAFVDEVLTGDGGPAIVPPAVHPIDTETEEERRAFEKRRDALINRVSIPGRAPTTRERAPEPEVLEAAAPHPGEFESPDAEASDENSPTWMDDLDGEKRRRRPVTSYRLTVITLLVLALPATVWLFRDQVAEWWQLRGGAGPSGIEARPTPEDTAPSPILTDSTEAVVDTAKVSSVTLTGPDGGEVWVDGVPLDGVTTPVPSLPLEPGAHVLRVVYGKLGEWRHSIIIPADEAVLDATPRGHIRLSYGGRPLAKEVRLDGTSLGHDPRVPVSVPAGDHIISIGEEDLIRRIFVAGGDTVHVPLPAAPAGQGLLVVESRRFVGDGFDPSEADSVWVNRGYVGRTPFERAMSPGVYSVRVSRKGESHVQVVDLLPDGMRVVRADFGSEPRLSLRHAPEGRLRKGEPIFLTTNVDQVGTPGAKRLFCLYRVRPGSPFRSREMRRVQENSTYWVASVPEAETAKGWLEYYFTAIDTDGVQVVSEIFSLGQPTAEVASR